MSPSTLYWNGASARPCPPLSTPRLSDGCASSCIVDAAAPVVDSGLLCVVVPGVLDAPAAQRQTCTDAHVNSCFQLRFSVRFPQSVTGEYDGGTAPGADLINVRVLGADGSGVTSRVIAAVDWLVANRAHYGIRIVNLSLGTTITAPCPFDPMRSSVQRLVQAGMIAVVSGGNRRGSRSSRAIRIQRDGDDDAYVGR